MEQFPHEVLLEIFAFCGERTVFELGKVCKLFRQLSMDKQLTRFFGHEKNRRNLEERLWFFAMMKRTRVFGKFLGVTSTKEYSEYLCPGNKVSDFRRRMSEVHMSPPHYLIIYYLDGEERIVPSDEEVVDTTKIYFGKSKVFLW
ncbi:F-box containing protein [Marseillevirus marseillevirus]|uniref:F-box containing protein n=1 Tax=Marseillevirus marseillevirus TaxID=694581 RepID=D2XAF0_GBMV|nr:F-box containing protein [Marseillevirus marseillevirus]ADB03927.1 F-box containing protein [Marseillevirus marseillevirus]